MLTCLLACVRCSVRGLRSSFPAYFESSLLPSDAANFLVNSPETPSNSLPSGRFALLAIFFESFPSQRSEEIFEPFLHGLAFRDLVFLEKKLDVDVVITAVAYLMARAEDLRERGKHGKVPNILCWLRCLG